MILGQTSSTSESNQIELPDDINNYKLLILMYLSTDGDILSRQNIELLLFGLTRALELSQSILTIHILTYMCEHGTLPY